MPDAVYVGDHLVLVRTIYGRKMYVDTRDLSLGPHLIMEGNWEPWITDVFRRSLRPGMRVVDVGANMGWYTLISADLVGAKGKVDAYEANPALADLLYRNLLINGLTDRAAVHDAAVFSKAGEVTFTVNRRLMGSSSIFGSAQSAAAYRDTVDTQVRPAVTLDAEFPDADVAVLRIDAEGAEPHILLGAAKFLDARRDINVMMELLPGRYVEGVGEKAAFFDLISGRHGFKVWQICYDGSLAAVDAHAFGDLPHCDVVLARDAPFAMT